MAIVIELPEQRDQLATNRKRWLELCADKSLADRLEKIETNRFGEIIMSPPPRKQHGRFQVIICAKLNALLPDGVIVSESPVSTSDGVKGPDVTWASPERESLNPDDLYEIAPEICVEVVSPTNTQQQLAEKRALYFDAGAEECWICEMDGSMRFFLKANPNQAALQSKLCPEFPGKLTL